MKFPLHPSLRLLPLASMTKAQQIEVDKLPKRFGMNILRDRELYLVVADSNKMPQAALWTGWNASRFTFDVVVNYPARHLGVAKHLVEQAIAQYNQDAEGYSNPLLVVTVINQGMEFLLKDHFDFHVCRKTERDIEMMGPTMNDGRVLLPC